MKNIIVCGCDPAGLSAGIVASLEDKFGKDIKILSFNEAKKIVEKESKESFLIAKENREQGSIFDTLKEAEINIIKSIDRDIPQLNEPFIEKDYNPYYQKFNKKRGYKHSHKRRR